MVWHDCNPDQSMNGCSIVPVPGCGQTREMQKMQMSKREVSTCRVPYHLGRMGLGDDDVVEPRC
jgi:hypothetical protein